MAKYTDEMVAIMRKVAEQFDGPIPRDQFEQFVVEFNEKFGTDFTDRMLASKIRHLGYKVESKAKAVSEKKYTEAEEAKIREMCKDPDNLPYQEDIADALGKEVASIGGKLISMRIYGVKKRDRKETKVEKKFSPEEEAIILEMTAGDGEVFIEDIAKKVGKTVNQVRGKLAGMRIKGVKTRDRKAPKPKIYTEEVVAEIKKELASGMTIEQCAAKRELSAQGMRTTLIRLGVLPKKDKKVFWTSERIEKLAECAEAGMTLDEAASELGTTLMVVGKRAKADGLEFHKEEKAA